MLSGVSVLPQQFFYTWECTERGRGARSDSFFSSVKVIPSQRLHVRAQDEVGVAFPDSQLVLLCRVYRAADDLKDIRGSAAVAVLHAHGDADYRSGTEVPGGVRRNRGDEPAVCKAARANFHGFEQPWERTTRADGIHEIALREHDWFAGRQVRGNHC